MHIEIPHKLTQAEAVRKVKDMLNEGRSKISDYGSIDKEEWEGNTLSFAGALQGKKITGELEVREHEYVLDVTLPLMWRMFEGKIERMVEEQAKKVL